MKILVDENIPLKSVQALREMGHEVLDIRGTPDEGVTDEVLWGIVQQEKRLLITTDKGFTQYREQQHQGILVIRLKKPNRHKIHQKIMQIILQFSEAEWPGLLVVMRDVVWSVWRASQ
jgi:predicted nuclease of predicted toxin-antitoxin system